MNTLKAEKRSLDIKAKRLRREGYVTGNVFGKEMKESVPIKMDASEVDRLLKTCNKGSQIMLDIDGESHNVLIKDVDFNPLKGKIDEIDFQALVKDEVVHSVAEIVLENIEAVTTGVLQQQLEEVSYKALPVDLVDKIEIDASTLRVGDTIKVGDLAIAKDEKIHLMTDPEAVVVTVTESRNSAAADAEESEETEA